MKKAGSETIYISTKSRIGKRKVKGISFTLPEITGITLFMHYRYGRYRISEYTTGMLVSKSLRAVAAMAKAKSKFLKSGVKRMQGIIAKQKK